MSSFRVRDVQDKSTNDKIDYGSCIKSGINKSDNFFIVPITNMSSGSLSFLGKVLMFPIKLSIFLVSIFILYDQFKKGKAEYDNWKKGRNTENPS